ncbi:translation initiation factor IF-2-like [Leguminivora glycinivorella]|uniref:translation initiation factor IF-2-like n=1 Tax=Leguminivora glycinivorella TaxID=1035111 RepID=UPI00200C7817|nr:translation initiation factor IF-2-like [Leguminivora glycinivorella]
MGLISLPIWESHITVLGQSPRLGRTGIPYCGDMPPAVFWGAHHSRTITPNDPGKRPTDTDAHELELLLRLRGGGDAEEAVIEPSPKTAHGGDAVSEEEAGTPSSPGLALPSPRPVPAGGLPADTGDSEGSVDMGPPRALEEPSTTDMGLKFWATRPDKRPADDIALSSGSESDAGAVAPLTGTAKSGKKAKAGRRQSGPKDRTDPLGQAPIVLVERLPLSSISHLPQQETEVTETSPNSFNAGAESDSARSGARRTTRDLPRRSGSFTASGERSSSARRGGQQCGVAPPKGEKQPQDGGVGGHWVRQPKGDICTGPQGGCRVNRGSGRRPEGAYFLRRDATAAKAECQTEGGGWGPALRSGGAEGGAPGTLQEAGPTPSQPKEAPQPVTVPPGRSDVDELVGAVAARVGRMLDERLGALERDGRLLPGKTGQPHWLQTGDDRPRKRPQGENGRVSAYPGSPKLHRRTPKGRKKGDKKKAKGKGKGKKSAPKPSAKATATESPLPPAAEPPRPAAATSTDEGWKVAVGGRKKRRKAAAATRARAPQPVPQRAKPKARRLRPPRSAAVVLTLQPEAIESGVNYAQVLSRAKETVNLEQFGITALRFKRAAAGGRVLEIPGAASGEKADLLAEALTEKLGSDVVRVSRPVKCAELRVTELDDSVSPGEVVASVAKVGGCSEGQIKAGEVRQDASGLGTIWLRCPVVVAKKVVEADRGRLQVGWVRAAVKLLDQRPIRCFKCLETGHVRANCTNDADLSDACYRCGKPGHKAAACSEEPRCAKRA